ncbi:MAG: hypothetical protein M1823_001631 [Watsoniomyces obsoletus]|nr:MAG: hypothetical protein M1823_001631 [Watsoniomyces obsoletus]
MDPANFDVVFPARVRGQKLKESIDEAARGLAWWKEHILHSFFERLLTHQGLKEATTLYPPRSEDELRHLHGMIVSSKLPDHEQQAIILYLLLNTRDADLVEDFIHRCHLPDKYVAYMRGLWHHDRLETEAALEYLTQPSLTLLFAGEIFATVQKAPPDEDPTFAQAYYHTVSPGFEFPLALEMLVISTAEASITEAFFLSRRQVESRRKEFLEVVIRSAIQPRFGLKRVDRVMELVNLPFTAREEKWFVDFLRTANNHWPLGSHLTLPVREMAAARYVEAGKDWKSLKGKKMKGIDWEALRLGLSLEPEKASESKS